MSLSVLQSKVISGIPGIMLYTTEVFFGLEHSQVFVPNYISESYLSHSILLIFLKNTDPY